MTNPAASPLPRPAGDAVSLRGTTLIVAYRQASAERAENLRATLGFLQRTYCDFDLVLVEGDASPRFDLHALRAANLLYHFVEDPGPFNKARLLNLGARVSRSPVICFHDADMIGWPHLMRHAVDVLLDADISDVRTPHWSILNVAGGLKRRFCRTLDFAVFDSIRTTDLPPDVTRLYDNQSSGITFWRKDRFVTCGGYHEGFADWGGEDDELLIRATRLGLRWHSVPPPTFHLHHDAADRTALHTLAQGDPAKRALLTLTTGSTPQQLAGHANDLMRRNFGNGTA
ncbi:galactosyltransferase-related protein [Novosphingobium sp. FSW06-99]|uniref:galactosyltransferase-related protein n=1 Tax=Novosphingobium sp. FSW06-99 TaxID=1739113 RepID=UPI00076D8BD3|nr:galactosyltransferase-related protein [Novosphingobium sp. FSW06-99]KUR75387.1 hypothetical protein AQZ49_15020 [Novosphingobium sp. FSW06-99]